MNQQLQTMDTESGQRALFDYAALDQETQVLVRLRAGEIQSIAKRVGRDVVEIGEKLAEVKQRLNGKFAAWLEAELGWSERAAYNFIGVYQRFGSANFALENVAVSALYLLAAPSTPAEAVEVAKQIADQGEQVTHTVAKEIVRQAKAKQPKQGELVEEPDEVEETETSEDAGDFQPGFPPGFDPERAEQGLAQEDDEISGAIGVAVCLCGHSADDHPSVSCRQDCDCEMYQRATEKTLGIGQVAAPASPAKPAPVSARKPAAVETASKRPASWLNETTPKRPAAWYKQRVEIVITLMPGTDDRSRKIMHTVRVGDGSDAIPFVAVTTGEDNVVNNLPLDTWRLLNKAADAFAKKPAKPAAKPVSKPTTKSKPAAKKPATKTKTKKGEKKK